MENGLNQRNKVSDLLFMLPGLLFSLSVLIVRLHLFSMPMSDIYWSEATDTSTLSDVFNYWKAIVIITAAGLSAIVFVVAYFKGSFRFKKSFLYIPALVYVVFVLISYVFSDYKYFALRGMSEHFEGSLVLLAYMMMVFFLANTVDSERRLKYVVYCVLGAAFLLGILGITQATGHDFLSTAAGQKLMTPNYMLENGVKSWDMIDILAASGQKAYGFSFTEGEVYQTVYNINYVPFYLILLIPLSAFLFIGFMTSDSKRLQGVSFLVLGLYGLFLFNLFAANSASGYVGLFVVIVAFLILIRRRLKQWIKPFLCLLIVLGLVIGVTADRWLPELKKSFSSSRNILFDSIYAEELPVDYNHVYENWPGASFATINYIETNEKELIVVINGEGLRVSRDDDISAFLVTDVDGNQLYMRPMNDDATAFEILDDRFHDFVKISLIKDSNYSYIVLNMRSYDWLFKYDGTRFLYHNAVGKDVSLNKVEHASVFKQSLGSERGRIWNTTIPLLKKYVFAGSGADTFSFVFPQKDYATLYTLYWTDGLSLVTDKAHSIYLQYWVNTGLVSLVAWMVLIIYYLINAIKQYKKRKLTDFCDYVNCGIFCGILGFLSIALFNDGSVNTMPMFYTLLGLGFAVNMRDKWPGIAGTNEGNRSNSEDLNKIERSIGKRKTVETSMPEI